MSVKADELRGQLEHVLKNARDIAAKAETEDRDFSAEESAEVKKYLDEAKGIKDQLKKLGEDDELRKAVDALGDAVDLFSKTDSSAKSQNIIVPAKGKGSLGEQFVNNEQVQAWYKSVAPNGQFSEKASIISPTVEFDGLKGLKAIITSGATSGGALSEDQFLGLQSLGVYARPLTVRDVVTNGTTGSDAVKYVRVNTTTNAAATVAEASASTGTSGTKPESTMTLEVITANVKTIAHWVPATTRTLSDAGQLRTLIDNFLTYGLEEELEDQMITGDGTGENFEGIGTVSGVQAQTWDTNILTTTRKARTKVKVVGRDTPNAYLLHPEDWEKIDLLQDAEDRYYFGGPMQLGTPRLWGLPVIESEGVPAGTGYVGNFRKAVLWDREQASVQVSNSHSDFFIRNMVAILAELRAAFGVLAPKSFVEIDLTA